MEKAKVARGYPKPSANLLVQGLVVACIAVLAGCGDSRGVDATAGSGGTVTNPPPAATPPPSDFPGTTTVIPAAPEVGKSRPGTAYNVYIKGPKTGDKIAFTVFEPATITGGATYPLLLHSHGFAGSRDTPGSSGGVGPFVASNYGAISIDERGHGESTGTIRVMDPDAEGQNLLAILDWAEAHLPWLEYRTSVDGSDPRNLVLGSLGQSYGGMFQYLVHNIDPKRRLDVITPEIAPNNLNFSLFPGTVTKTTWNVALFGAGNAGGLQGGTAANFDPYIRDNFATGLAQGTESQGFKDFFYYHSNDYFCGSGVTVATNGGEGTAPSYPPLRGSKVHALLYQGVRDTLFNLSDGIRNYDCLKAQGGDVRFLSYQSGHNSLAPVVPDPGLVYLGGPSNSQDTRCGTLSVDAARLLFFDEHLKGIANAADAIPTKPCLSLKAGSAVLVDHIIHAAGAEGTEAAIPATTVVVGAANVPVAVPLGIIGADGGTLVAGVPHLTVKISPLAAGLPGSPTVFVGLGQTHNGVPAVYDLIDNMVLPITGAGDHEVDLIAIAALLPKGENLALLLYGSHDQFAVTGPTASQIPVQTVSISGAIRLPLPPAGSYTMAK